MAEAGYNTSITNNRHVLFLGAGASAPLGRLHTAQFLKILPQEIARFVARDRVNEFAKDADWTTALKTLCSQSARHYNVDTPDSEVLLDYLDHLVKTCESMQNLPPLYQTLARTNAVGSFHKQWADMFLQLRKYILSVVLRHYAEVPGPEALALYKPLLSSFCPGMGVLPIFTTNYDWTFENLSATDDTDFRLVDGFKDTPVGDQWARPVFDNFQKSEGKTNLVLFKLHGSTSWYKSRNKEPAILIRKLHEVIPDSEDLQTLFVPPTQVKIGLIREEPFKTAYGYLEACLARGELCCVVGYSFRDFAVSETFKNALAKNDKLKLLVVEPSINDQSGQQFNTLVSRLGLTDSTWKSRIHVIKGFFGDSRSPWVPGAIDAVIKRLNEWEKLKSWIDGPGQV